MTVLSMNLMVLSILVAFLARAVYRLRRDLNVLRDKVHDLEFPLG